MISNSGSSYASCGVAPQFFRIAVVLATVPQLRKTRDSCESYRYTNSQQLPSARYHLCLDVLRKQYPFQLVQDWVLLTPMFWPPYCHGARRDIHQNTAPEVHVSVSPSTIPVPVVVAGVVEGSGGKHGSFATEKWALVATPHGGCTYGFRRSSVQHRRPGFGGRGGSQVYRATRLTKKTRTHILEPPAR